MAASWCSRAAGILFEQQRSDRRTQRSGLGAQGGADRGRADPGRGGLGGAAHFKGTRQPSAPAAKAYSQRVRVGARLGLAEPSALWRRRSVTADPSSKRCVQLSCSGATLVLRSQRMKSAADTEPVMRDEGHGSVGNCPACQPRPHEHVQLSCNCAVDRTRESPGKDLPATATPPILNGARRWDNSPASVGLVAKRLRRSSQPSAPPKSHANQGVSEAISPDTIISTS